jgi:hypothetical protein
MRTEPPRVDADAAGELANPAYWLVFGLRWPADSVVGGGEAEAAIAVAPGMIPREAVGREVRQVLGCADLYATEFAERLVLFSDLTRMFTGAGTSWGQLGVDWESAVRELREGPFPVLNLTISEHAHLIICDPTAGLSAAGPGESDDERGTEREVVRQAIAGQLAADWPSWMNALIEAGRVRQAT